jgi:hypothetical protein
MRHVMIVGASSAIAEATARCFASDGDRLYLLARDQGKLEAIAADLKVRGADKVDFQTFDANAFDDHDAVIAAAAESLGDLDTVLIAHGTLPDQPACEADYAVTLEAMTTNALSAISLLTRLANRFESQRRGTLAVISSVAGDRGRKSNYVYGTAKAAVSTFLDGLRNRLYGSGVKVVTAKPGFVDTPMTASFEKGLLWAQPDAVGRGIHQAIVRGKDVVYLPGFWRLIMMIIRHVPETVFKRLSL